MKDLFFGGFVDSLCFFDGDDLLIVVDMCFGDFLFSLEGEEFNVFLFVGLLIFVKVIIFLYFSLFVVCFLFLFFEVFFFVMYKINNNYYMIIF